MEKLSVATHIKRDSSSVHFESRNNKTFENGVLITAVKIFDPLFSCVSTAVLLFSTFVVITEVITVLFSK
ncbi:hypothetical protein A8F95_21045 [Bacillus wudalianchiensis]|uniref:Uncharacterized protein n=1 Tax=Pseudobacillus wudalianchiensis TaxID=1743143 RepID=A0A1B9B2B3_9BACI|nr:hypothetical protein A8F95_21045 [Bacillus wudalianchiensis]